MLNSFLRDVYKSKVLSAEFLQKNLSNWKITQNTLTKTFVFTDFKRAMTFATLAEGRLKEKQVQSKM